MSLPVQLLTTLSGDFIGRIGQTGTQYTTVHTPLRVAISQAANGRYGGAFVPVTVFNDLDKIHIHESQIIHPPRPAPKQAEDEYLRITTGIVLP